MARFTFPLEAVLEARRERERSRQQAVAALERERIDIERRIAEYQNTIAETKQSLRDALRSGSRSEARELRLHTSNALMLQGKAQQLTLQLAGAYKRLEHARAELASASADRKAVELMRERALEEWRRNEQRRERAELDDLACARHARGREAVL